MGAFCAFAAPSPLCSASRLKPQTCALRPNLSTLSPQQQNLNPNPKPQIPNSKPQTGISATAAPGVLPSASLLAAGTLETEVRVGTHGASAQEKGQVHGVGGSGIMIGTSHVLYRVSSRIAVDRCACVCVCPRVRASASCLPACLRVCVPACARACERACVRARTH